MKDTVMPKDEKDVPVVSATQARQGQITGLVRVLVAGLVLALLLGSALALLY